MLQRDSSLHGFALVILNQTSQPAPPLIGSDATRPARLGARASSLCRDAATIPALTFARSLAQIWHRRVAPASALGKRALASSTGGGIGTESAGATA